MKTIGIVARKTVNTKGNETYYFSPALITYLKKYEIKILGILYDKDSDLSYVKDVIDMCDGIILPGGKYIGNIDYEIPLYLHKINKPTLGICLGMQSMGKALNGKVINNVDGHRSSKKYSHKVVIGENSLLQEILGESEIMVNSLHNYAIPNACSYDPLNVAAYSEDGVIEALEDKNKAFFIGVQWHPELLPDDPNSTKLFDYFISSFN